jgi:hypothetical protein
MSTNSETIATAAAKLSPPVTVSLANIGGYQVSEVVMVVTLIYTIALLMHKLWQIFTDVFDRIDKKRSARSDRRRGQADDREIIIERRTAERRWS